MIKTFITPDDGYHYFFGYYDLQPYDGKNTMHLTHRVKFMDRSPKAGDVCELGYIDLLDNTFHKITETLSWNFQQGAFLQWFESGKSIIFNDYKNGEYVSRVVDISGKELKVFNKPFGSITADRKFALSINFARIFNFRSGYGYQNKPDEFYGEKAPENDGLYLYDLQNDTSKLILSYKKIKEEFFEEPFTSQKLVINHVTFNPSGNKYCMLLRNMEGEKWGTVLAVGDVYGNVKKLTNFEVNSHYSWKDDENLMIYSGLPKWGIYFIDTVSGERSMLDNGLINSGDIHCNYSPDRKTFIGDTYPCGDSRRKIYLYDFESKGVKELVNVFSVNPLDVNDRCDLHARWNVKGCEISYDTTERNKREIVRLQFEKDELRV